MKINFYIVINFKNPKNSLLFFRPAYLFFKRYVTGLTIRSSFLYKQNPRVFNCWSARNNPIFPVTAASTINESHRITRIKRRLDNAVTVLKNQLNHSTEPITYVEQLNGIARCPRVNRPKRTGENSLWTDAITRRIAVQRKSELRTGKTFER